MADSGEKVLNLYDHADQISDVREFTIQSPEGKFGKIQCTTIPLPVTVKKPEGNVYYFLVMQYWVLNSSNFWTADDWNIKGRYVTQLSIDNRPANLDDSVAHLIRSSPDTDTGGTSISSGFSYGFGANAGFFGGEATGGISADISFSHSETFFRPDVAIDCRSSDDGNNAKWLFNMPQVSYSDVWNHDLSNPGQMSHSTFQPIVYMLWQTRQKQDSFTLDTKVICTTEVTTNDWQFVYSTINRQTTTYTCQFSKEIQYAPEPSPIPTSL